MTYRRSTDDDGDDGWTGPGPSGNVGFFLKIAKTACKRRIGQSSWSPYSYDILSVVLTACLGLLRHR